MLVMDSIGLLVGMVGFGTMLASAVGFSQLLWVALLFALALVVMRRENLNGTIAAALVIGTVILGLAGGMIVLGLLHLDPGTSRRQLRARRAVRDRTCLRSVVVRLFRPHVRRQRCAPGSAA